MILANQIILLTGGSGSFGNSFCEIALQHEPKEIRVFSRGEMLQKEMSRKFNDRRLSFFIGDVRDRDRLNEAMRGVDIVVHAAALKDIVVCENNPTEAIKTNVCGAMNVVGAAVANGVGKVIGISSDKAVHPVNLYGMTKACMEKLFIQANTSFFPFPKHWKDDTPSFSCVRYGNVLGSRGSVVNLFKQQKDTGRVTITDERMTRFWITLEAGVQFVIDCLDRMEGGEIFVPKLPSMKITDLATAIAPNAVQEIVGIRAGEKLHEVLISEDEARHTGVWEKYYVITESRTYKYIMWVRYSSDNNTDWLTVEQMRGMIE